MGFSIRGGRKIIVTEINHPEGPPNRPFTRAAEGPHLRSTGAAMTPGHTRKNGKLYRYYVSTGVIRDSPCACPIRRVPAAQIEEVVVAQMRTMVQAPEIIVATWRAAKQAIKGLTERQVRDELHRFNDLWSELFPAEQAKLVQLLVSRVVVSEKGTDITCGPRVSPA